MEDRNKNDPAVEAYLVRRDAFMRRLAELGLSWDDDYPNEIDADLDSEEKDD